MSENLLYLNDDNFDETVAKGVTLVDFYADWCGPCRVIAPVIEELAKEMYGQATIAKLDVEGAQKVTSKFQVMSIPTLILFKNGEEVKRIVGVRSKDDLKALVLAEI